MHGFENASSTLIPRLLLGLLVSAGLAAGEPLSIRMVAANLTSDNNQSIPRTTRTTAIRRAPEPAS